MALWHRPALRLALLLACGIAAGWEGRVSPAWSAALLCLFLILSGILVARGGGTASGALLAAAVFCFGMLKVRLDAGADRRHGIGALAADTGRIVEAEGAVGGGAARRGGRVVWTIAVERIRSAEGTVRAAGDVRASMAGGVPDEAVARLAAGRIVRVRGRLTPLPRPRNPGEFDYGGVLELQGIRALLLVSDTSDVAIRGAPAGPVISLPIGRWREEIGRLLDSLAGGEEAKLLKGLVIGERSDMSSEAREAFISSGLMHILAVSGFNVGLVLLGLWTVLGVMRLPPGLLAAACGAGLILFVLLTGTQAPVVRAAVMAGLVLGARVAGRRPDLPNALGAAALVLLLLDARSLFDAGFQLSFASVAALGVLEPKLRKAAGFIPPGLPGRAAFRYIFDSAAVTLAATAGTLPLTIFHFHRVSLVGIAANLVGVPLSGIALSLGACAVAVSGVSPWLASVYAAPAALAARLLLGVADFCGSLPFASVSVGGGAPVAVVLYAAMLAALEFGRPAARRVILLCALAAADAAVAVRLVSPARPYLRVTFLDVGQGDAAFVEFPSGGTLLVDAGPRTRWNDAGERVLVPFLRSRGADRIGALLVTHPHSDHIGGAPSLLRSVRADSLFDAGSLAPSELFGELRRLVDSLRIPRRVVAAGSVLGGTGRARVYVLHPSGPFLPSGSGDGSNLNNESVVLRIVYGRTSLLLSGDAEEGAERRIAAAYGGFLRSGLLKVGHHGSATSSSREYLGLVRPSIAVISAGARNLFGHPSARTTGELWARGCDCRRTDRDGAVVVESDGTAWRVVEWR